MSMFNYAFDNTVLAAFDDELLTLSSNIAAFLESDELDSRQLSSLFQMQRSARALNDYFALVMKLKTLNESSAS